MTPEQLLAERCRSRESQAFRELYDTYAGRLLFLCARYAATQVDAEDILQDSFIKIIQSFDSFRYRGEGSLYAWMRRITVNKALDFVRTAGRFPTETMADADADAKEIYIDDNDVGTVPEDVLLRFIRELPPGYKTVFNMFALDGFSHKEVAQCLGIKERTSSSQYHRARTMLAEKIKDYLNRHD